MIKRFYDIDTLLQKGKVLVIYGARQVGKTTLLKAYLTNSRFKSLYCSGDNIVVQSVLSSQDLNKISEFVEDYELIAIDEAQKVPNIGMSLKMIVDNMPEKLVIATGSSSFELSQNIGEPLTGRKITVQLFPIALKELALDLNRFEIRQRLNEFLIFGMYPEVITAETKTKKITILIETADSYLLKDILTLERVKSPKVLLNLLKLLAFQIGNLVSVNELATQLGIDAKTVSRYLDLLEKGFVIRSVSGFSKNPRKEVTKKQKYYFIDNGIRNAVIRQFNDIEDRNDIGALWENFVFMERQKKLTYEGFYGYTYFWRSFTGNEIDIVEEKDGRIYGYEIKWGRQNVRIPNQWQETYKEAGFGVIDKENFLDYVL
ncbi:MAG: ATP-binding protein [Thermodesulfovibrionales bacterium]|nr:ATP-binding protein [Thermodesulfovibrionales bacterium]